MSIQLTVDSLSHCFGSELGKHYLFRDLTVAIPAGSSASISGVSGSGKSSLLCLLAGLDSIQQGSVQYFDRDNNRLSKQDIKQRASFIFQDFHLLEGLSVSQNVALPLLVKGENLAQERTEYWLEKVGLEHKLHSDINRLSRGEQQRVAIARAFVSGPQLIFADEPTSSLDIATAQLVQDMFIDLSNELDVTTIYVTHDMSFAAKAHMPFKLTESGLTPV